MALRVVEVVLKRVGLLQVVGLLQAVGLLKRVVVLQEVALKQVEVLKRVGLLREVGVRELGVLQEVVALVVSPQRLAQSPHKSLMARLSR